jgi:mycothiol synthase
MGRAKAFILTLRKPDKRSCRYELFNPCRKFERVNPRIRAAELTDLPAIVAIHAAAVPSRPHSLHELTHDLTKLEDHLKPQLIVAEHDGQILGVASFSRSAGSYHPHKFHLELYVHPDSRGRGVGAALFDVTLEALKPLEAISVRTQVREDEASSLRFAQARGFTEDKRDFESLLDVQAFDAAPYSSLEARLAAEGVTLRSWRELDSEAFRRELHAVFSEVRLDVPRSEPATPISFEFFDENVVSDAELAWDASFASLEGNRITGFTGAFQGAKSGVLDQWLTATTREARGRGIATALKVRQLEAAQRLGFVTVRTDNDTRNAPMLAVNAKLGFVRQPAVLSLAKVL